MGAQALIPSQDPSYWDGANLVLINQNAGQGVKAGTVLAPNGKELQSTSRPGSRAALDFHDGQFYSYHRMPMRQVAAGEKKKFETPYTLSRFENGAWIPIGTGVWPLSGATKMFHLRNGNWLAVGTSFELFEDDKKGYPFAIVKPNDEKVMAVQSRMDLDMEKGFFDNAKRTERYGRLVLPFMGGSFTRTPDHIVIWSYFGHFWVFGAEDGRLVRVAKLYPGVKDKMLEGPIGPPGYGDNPLMPGLHGVIARPTGTILIACREEDAVLHGMLGRNPSIEGSVLTKLVGGPGAAADEKAENPFDQTNTRYPIVEWWDFDPATGKFERELPPDGLPEQLTTEQAVLDMNLRCKPNGTVEAYSLKERNRPNEEGRAKAKAAAEKAEAEKAAKEARGKAEATLNTLQVPKEMLPPAIPTGKQR